MKWLNRLRCELQDHIRVTEIGHLDVATMADVLTELHLKGEGYCSDSHMDDAMFVVARYPPRAVTRCTRCGWTSRRMDG